MRYKFLEHTADVKFQSYGKTLEEAFKNAALAMQEVMTKKVKIKSRIKKKIKVEGRDKESLLRAFLEEFLFLLDSKGWILSSVKSLKIQDLQLEAEVLGDEAKNYKFTNDVKAVTYNQMQVKKDKSRWICQVVLDV